MWAVAGYCEHRFGPGPRFVAFVTIYRTAGGLRAVIQTDVYPFLVLVVGFVITLLFCLPDLLSAAGDLPNRVPDFYLHVTGDKGWVFLVTTFLAFLLGETFSPAYATRHCAGRDVRHGVRGARRSWGSAGCSSPTSCPTSWTCCS